MLPAAELLLNFVAACLSLDAGLRHCNSWFAVQLSSGSKLLRFSQMHDIFRFL